MKGPYSREALGIYFDKKIGRDPQKPEEPVTQAQFTCLYKEFWGSVSSFYGTMTVYNIMEASRKGEGDQKFVDPTEVYKRLRPMWVEEASVSPIVEMGGGQIKIYNRAQCVEDFLLTLSQLNKQKTRIEVLCRAWEKALVEFNS